MAKTEKDQGQIAIAKGLKNVPWCDDYEKMISGVLYDSMVPELVQGRFKARQFMHKFNNHFPDDATPESLSADRTKLLRGIMGRIGNDPIVEPPFSIDYGANIIIGDSFYSNFNLVILDCAIVRIGNRVMFGPNVSIYSATHEVEVQSRRDFIEFAAPVTIGDDCWIGGGSTILPGVTIGKGCTIGAGSVVTKSIPDFSVAVGSPARVIKKVTPVPDMPGDAQGQTAHGSVVA